MCDIPEECPLEHRIGDVEGITRSGRTARADFQKHHTIPQKHTSTSKESKQTNRKFIAATQSDV